MKTVTIDELKNIFQRIIDKLEQDKISSINITQDYYRFIPTDTWDSFDDEVLAGSLFDDIDSLKTLISDNRPTMYVDLDRLASVLRLISEVQNSAK